MTSSGPDPVIRDLREAIAGLDREILEALNRRIALVRRLKEYKEAQGLDFYDAAQEGRVLDALCRANRGPLSETGLREIFGLLLAVAKREAAGA